MNKEKQDIRNTTGTPQNVLAKQHMINNKIETEILPALPSFVKLYDDYLSAEDKSIKTREAYLLDIKRFMEYMLGTAKLSDAKSTKDITLEDISKLTAFDLNEYLKYIKAYPGERGNKTVTIENKKDSRARKRSSIAGLLKFLYLNDLINADVTTKVASVSIKDTGKIVKALTEEELDELIEIVTTGEGLSKAQKHYWEKTRYRDKMILILFALTGLRLSELQQLNISSFNLKRKTFTIYRKRGKIATVPMNKTVQKAFEEYIELDRGKCRHIAEGSKDALFLSLETVRKDSYGNPVILPRKRLSENQLRAIVHKYTKIVIGGPGYSPHKLRATAATLAIKKGNDISLVASLLDHDSVQTTQRYIRKTEEDKKAVLETMEIER